jgi:transcriptional regulator with XRE-family HTH domain
MLIGMPVVRSIDAPNFEIFGKNVRAERQIWGWSIQRLAAEAGIAPDTVFRIEHGSPCTKATRKKLADALHCDQDRLMMQPTDIRPGFAIHHREEARWKVLTEIPNRKRADDEVDLIQENSERKRLGDLGFVTMFVKMMNCRLQGGRLVAGLLEIYGEGLHSNYVDGEVFLLVLEGKVRIHLVGQTSFVLSADDAATVDCKNEFYFVKEGDEDQASPARMLYVRIDQGV